MLKSLKRETRPRKTLWKNQQIANTDTKNAKKWIIRRQKWIIRRQKTANTDAMIAQEELGKETPYGKRKK